MTNRMLFFLLFATFSLSIYSQNNNICDDMHTYTYVTGLLQCEEIEYGDWELIFEDDFDNTTINREKWYTCIDGWNREHGDNELQYYLDENVILENGLLKLTAQRQPDFYNVWRFNDEGGSITSKFFEYTSGWIQTKSKFKYGLFEVRCRIPDGQGFWPAFWLFGNGEEIDIFEFASNKQDESLTTLHKWHNDGGHEYCPESWKSNTSFANDYHTFSLEWDEYRLIFRVDENITRCIYYVNSYNINGQIVHHYCDNISSGFYFLNDLYPENPQSIILNLAIPSNNSSFGPSPNSQTSFPSSLDIDYVRIYKKNNNNKDITICDNNSSITNYYTGNTISAGGNCSVTISNNEHLELIACDEIILKDGVEIKEGGNFNARISPASKDSASRSQNNNNYHEKGYSYEYTNVTKDKDGLFDIFPNPCNNNFYIQFHQTLDIYNEIKIYDILGNLIYTNNHITEQTYNIDINKTGIYIIKCTTSNNINTKKIIVEP